MYFRQLLNDRTACASYLLGCKTHGQFAVVEPHADLVDDYVRLAAEQGARITAVLDTHVQADHVSGLPLLAERTGASAYLPDGAGVEFPHVPLASVCGRGLSANPTSTIGFERRHNRALQFDSEDEFVAALLREIPPAPDRQAAILAANRAGDA